MRRRTYSKKTITSIEFRSNPVTSSTQKRSFNGRSITSMVAASANFRVYFAGGTYDNLYNVLKDSSDIEWRMCTSQNVNSTSSNWSTTNGTYYLYAILKKYKDMSINIAVSNPQTIYIVDPTITSMKWEGIVAATLNKALWNKHWDGLRAYYDNNEDTNIAQGEITTNYRFYTCKYVPGNNSAYAYSYGASYVSPNDDLCNYFTAFASIDYDQYRVYMNQSYSVGQEFQPCAMKYYDPKSGKLSDNYAIAISNNYKPGYYIKNSGSSTNVAVTFLVSVDPLDNGNRHYETVWD